MAAKRNRPILYIGWDDQSHNYIAKLILYVLLRSPGNKDRHFKISHDDWCAFFKGRACNCDPDIREMFGWEVFGS